MSTTENIRPVPVTRSDIAFGCASGLLQKLLPAWESIPEAFQCRRDPWCDVVSTWFFRGLMVADLHAVDGVDKTQALAHCEAIMGSFELSHEHKIAGVAYLMSLWFQPVKS